MTVKTASSLYAQHAINYLLLLTNWNLFIAYGAWFAEKTGHGACNSQWLAYVSMGRMGGGVSEERASWKVSELSTHPMTWSSSLQQPAGFRSGHCLPHAMTQPLLFHLLVLAVIIDNNEESNEAIAFLNWVYSLGAFQSNQTRGWIALLLISFSQTIKMRLLTYPSLNFRLSNVIQMLDSDSVIRTQKSIWQDLLWSSEVCTAITVRCFIHNCI